MLCLLFLNQTILPLINKNVKSVNSERLKRSSVLGEEKRTTVLPSRIFCWTVSRLAFSFHPSTFSVVLPDNCLIDCGGGSKGCPGHVSESATAHGSLKPHMSQADTAVLRLALILTHECQTTVWLSVLHPYSKSSPAGFFKETDINLL